MISLGTNRWTNTGVLLTIYNHKKTKMDEQEAEDDCPNEKS